MSDYPSRLRAMADFSLESPTVTKLVPAAFPFLREVAAYITELEAKLETPMADKDIPHDPPNSINPKIPENFLLEAHRLWDVMTGSTPGGVEVSAFTMNREDFVHNVGGAMAMAAVAAKMSDSLEGL